MKKNLFCSTLICIGLLLSSGLFAQKTNFTIEDAINVKSLGSQTLSSNGQFLAGTIADGRSRFGTDHFRFRDPSYLRTNASELVIINTSTGVEIRPFTSPVMVTGLQWTDDTGKLVFFQQKGDKMTIAYFDMNSKKVNEVKMKDS